MCVVKWIPCLLPQILFHFPGKYNILENSFQTDHMKVW